MPENRLARRIRTLISGGGPGPGSNLQLPLGELASQCAVPCLGPCPTVVSVHSTVLEIFTYNKSCSEKHVCDLCETWSAVS